jgi:RNA polymerase sigma factor (sigma-70 family)
MQESDSFEELVRASHAGVYRSAYRVLRSPVDAEDVTQEVFLRLWKRGAHAIREASAESLRGTALQLALNRLRGARRRAKHEKESAARRSEVSYDESVENAELRQLLRAELDSLPEELRTSLVLRYQEELSLERAAALLGCALSTVHQRIERGLARLGGRLRELGLSATPALLELELQQTELPELPLGLEARLLEIPAAAGAASAVTPALGVGPLAKLGTFVLVAALVGFAVPRIFDLNGATQSSDAPAEAVDGPGGSSLRAARGASSQDNAAPRRVLVSDDDELAEAQAPKTAVLRGFVRAASGGPLPGALVSAVSLAYWGKAPAHSRSTRTDAQGAYELHVPVPEEDGYRYRLFARLEGHVPVHGEPFVALRDKTRSCEPIVLEKQGSARPSRWSVDLVVVDANGSARAGVEVRILRQSEDPRAWTPWTSEAKGRSDEQGRLTLEGTHLGDKRILLDGRRVGGSYERRAWLVGGPGPRELRVLNPAGHAIAGTLRNAAGLPLPGFALRAWQSGDGDETSHGWTDKQGRFRIEGLRKGRVTLMVRQQSESPPPRPRQMQAGADKDEAMEEWAQQILHYSPFTTEVQAGEQELLLQPKSLVETRSLGLHDGELHGRVLDEQGKAVPCDGFELRAVPVPAGVLDAQAWRLDWIAERVHQRPVQRAIFGPQPPEGERFHLVGLAPGRYVIAFEKHGYAPTASEPLYLHGDQLLSGLSLRVSRGLTLDGRALDAAGEPLAGALILVTELGEEGRAKLRDLQSRLREARDERVTLPVGCVRSDAQGRWQLERLPAGVPLVLHALHEKAGRASSGRRVLRPGAPALTLRLRR